MHRYHRWGELTCWLVKSYGLCLTYDVSSYCSCFLTLSSNPGSCWLQRPWMPSSRLRKTKAARRTDCYPLFRFVPVPTIEPSLTRLLQLLLLKHCSKPLSVLQPEEDGPEPSTIPEQFQHHLLVKVTQDMDKYAEAASVEEIPSWTASLRDVVSGNPSRILRAVSRLRRLFFMHAKRFRYAFEVLRVTIGGAGLISSVDLFDKLQDEAELDKVLKKVMGKVKYVGLHVFLTLSSTTCSWNTCRKYSLKQLEDLLQEVERVLESRAGEDSRDDGEASFAEQISAALVKLRDEAEEPDDPIDPSPSSKRTRVDLSTIDGVRAMASSSRGGSSRYAGEICGQLEDYLR